MAAIARTLIQKLQQLPPQRLAEVEDFVEFLAARETRANASTQLAACLTSTIRNIVRNQPNVVAVRYNIAF